MYSHYTHTWLELSRSSLEHNIACYKNNIFDKTMLGVVVKSNAYGHGMNHVAQICEKNDAVGYICTANVTEAIALREYGIKKPILVMYFLNADPQAVVQYDLDLIIFDYETAALLNDIAKKQSKKVRVHVKVDTGMSRFGFSPEEAFDVIKRITKLSHVILQGIATHFAQSDQEDQLFTRQQLTHFSNLIDKLGKDSITIPIKHTANSAAVISNKDTHHNLVRVGAGIYGILPKHILERHSDQLKLKQPLTWKTRIIHIKKIPNNTSVSYDRMHTTTRETTIGILPIGYYEGYDRKMSNNGSVVVCPDGVVRLHNHYAPVLGRVCMNMTIIDVTDIPQARVGDEVILMGDYDNVRAYDLAHRIGSFNPREITTRLPEQIPCIVV